MTMGRHAMSILSPPRDNFTAEFEGRRARSVSHDMTFRFR